MMRKILYTAYWLFSLCLLLGTVEVVLRVVDFTPTGVFIPSFQKDTPGDLEPGIKVREKVNSSLAYTVSSDARGFRSNNIGHTGTNAPKVRILCLGDSYTYGYGVDDAFTYPAQLESMLSLARPDLAFDVMNAGFPRYGIAEEASFFERKGETIKPDVVVLQFFLNDIQDMVRQPSFGLFLQQLVRPGRQNFFERALARTELYRFARKINIARTSRHPAYESEQERQVLVQGSPYRDTLSADERRLVSTYEGIVSDASMRVLAPLWQEYLGKVLTLRDAVEKSGAGFLFVIVPDAHQITDYQLAASAALVPALIARGVDVLDLTFDFMAQYFDESTPLFLQSDPHCSPAGNALIARRIADGLAFVQQRPLWAADRLPVRDCSAVRRCGLHFDARSNTVVVSSSDKIVGKSLQDNLSLVPDKEFAITALAPTDKGRPGLLELQTIPGCAAAFLDVRFHYRLPRPDSSITLLVSEDGKTYVPVKEIDARGAGLRTNLDTKSIVQIPLMPSSDQRCSLRFVLRGGANLLTDTPGDGKVTPRPFELNFYPSLVAAGPMPDVTPTSFPAPVPGDLFNLATLERSVDTKGLRSIEHDGIGQWRWGLGPESTIAFQLDQARELSLQLDFTNVIRDQQLVIVANGKELTRLNNLPQQAWLREKISASVRFQGQPGENRIVIRYEKWNGNGATVSQQDQSPYAVAFTRLIIQGL